MLVNKRLKILISFFIILFLIFGIFQLYPNLAQYIKIIKICLMALFFMIPSYMIYLVNFKKENKLKL